MAEETAAPGEDPVVVRARKRMEQAIEAESKNREKQRDDMRFLAATSDEPEYQWPTIILNQRRLPGTAGFNRPTFVINKMRSHQNQVLNEQRMNRPQMKTRPADSKSSKEVSKALNGWLRHVQVASEADLAYDTACMWQTGGGEGFFRMHTEFCDEMSMNQEVVIAQLPDRFKVYLDPIGLRLHPAGRKCRWGFIVEDLPRDEYDAIYGEENAVDWNLTGVGDMVTWFQAQHTVRVAEYFEIEQREKMLCEWKGPDGTLATALTGSHAEKSYITQGWVKSGRERNTKIPRCIWRKMNGQKVIGKAKDMPTRFVPIIRVTGNEFVIDGELLVDGMVRPAKDAQRTFNYNRSKEAEVNALAPLAPITAAVDQIKGHEPMYEQSNTTPLAYLPYNLVRNDDESIVAIAPPARVAPPMPPAALIQASINADQDIKATMGQWGPALGEPSSEKSGKAINARKVESDVGTFHFMDNLRRALRYAGTIAIDMAAEIIESRQLVRIIGEDGEPDHIIVDPDSPVPYREEKGPDGKKVCIYNFGLGKYEVDVDTGASFTTRRAEAAEFLTSAVQSAKDPATASTLTYLAMKNQDWAGAEEAVTALKALLPPPVQQALAPQDGEQQVPPELKPMIDQLKGAVGHMKGQLEAASQAIQQRDQTLASLEQQVKSKDREALTKMYAVDKETMAEITRAMADVEVAKANAIVAAAQQPGNQALQAVVPALDSVLADMNSKIELLAQSALSIKSQLDNFEIQARLPGQQEAQV